MTTIDTNDTGPTDPDDPGSQRYARWLAEEFEAIGVNRDRLAQSRIRDLLQIDVDGEVNARAVFRLLDGFVREGRVNKLILLHGPNGSAKSTFVKTMMRALEAYSRTDEGALYRFNWVFPNEKLASGGSAIGFGFNAKIAESNEFDSFAFLDEDEINAKISSDLNDHPLLLIPQAQRADLLQSTIDDAVRRGNELLRQFEQDNS